jgi:hypothetical protein
MAPVRSEVICPNCGHGFDSTASIMRHLNHLYSSCTHWFISKDQPLPSQPPMDEGFSTNPCTDIDTRGVSIKYPFAGHVHGHSHSFMESFHTDKFSEEWIKNPYYPFSSRGDWQLASFLSRANLSMKFIDEFLSLELVCVLHHYC